jgi:hypothetical protein
MNECLNESMNKIINKQTNKRTFVCVCVCVCVCMYRWHNSYPMRTYVSNRLESGISGNGQMDIHDNSCTGQPDT